MAGTEILNLYQKLAKIRSLVDIVKKDKSGYGYKYADVNEILAKVKGGMDKYGVALEPDIVHGSANVSLQRMVKNKITKDGGTIEDVSYEYLYDSDMSFTWVNIDDPSERIVVPWHIVGAQSDPSQAFGSALTYTTRYFLLSYFQIAQDNDVDQYRKKQHEAKEAYDVETSAEIVKAFSLAVRTFLSDHPDKRDAVNEFTLRYAKSGNIHGIKEPPLAAKMFSDFKKEFLGESDKDDE